MKSTSFHEWLVGSLMEHASTKCCPVAFVALTLSLAFSLGTVSWASERSNQRPLHFAISAMISSRETFSAYQGLLSYLSSHTGREVLLKQRRTYQEVNDLLRFGEVDFAFICTGGYLDAKESFDPEILAVPVVRGSPYYHSYIIVNAESPISSFEGLKGKRFAFVDPLSNTGKLYPTYLIYKKGYSFENFFSSYFYTYSHDHSIESVAYRLVTGAAVDSLIYRYIQKLHPDVISRTKIIQVSPPFGIPPIVGSETLKREGMKDKVVQAFLYMHESAEGKAILRKLLIDRFILPPGDLYRSAFEMRRFLKSHVIIRR